VSILKILDELADDNSRLAKEAILKREVKNNLLRDVFKAAYDPMINYWIAKIPKYGKSRTHSYTVEEALKELKLLTNRTHTGNSAISHLTAILEECEEPEVIERIIGRDLRVGCSDSTANKVWPGLIPTFDVMLAHKDTSGIKYPAFAQVKFDGGRCHLMFDGSTATAYSRNGKIIEFCGALDTSARLLMKEGEVWDGEVVFRDANGKFLDRKTSNGHFNRGVKGTMTPEIAQYATFIAWDIVDFSSTLMYADRYDEYIRRWDKLSDVQKSNSNIWVAEAKTVKTETEAMEFYNNCIKHGLEGAIIKNIKSVWQPKRTKDLGKMKAEEEADLIVVGWELGTGRNKDRLGNLVCETADGKLQVRVGSGFNDDDRDQPAEYFLDKIVTVKYNQRIQDKKSGKWTLFLPIFIERRLDKDVANKFEELK